MRNLIISVFVFCSFSALALANSKAEITCYRLRYDEDRDGYAQEGSPSVKVQVNSSKKLTCPSGYVRYAGDCHDHNRNIHPYRSERPQNLIDDNCDGRVDETEFVYTDTGYAVTRNGFNMRAIINDREIVNNRNNLYVEVELSRLARSQNLAKKPKRRIALQVLGPRYYANIAIRDLVETTPYRARVRFYKRTVTRSPDGRRREIKYSQVGEVSNWYYSTTTGPKKKSRVRTRMLLRGFKQYRDSQMGLIGYRGTQKIDGKRFGASKGELWCSEFYSWVGKSWLRMIKGKSSVKSLITYFKIWGKFLKRNKIASDARRADYIAFDWKADGGKDHSAMFLAYDRSTSPHKVWTLEGNVGNRVKVKAREFNKEFIGAGHISKRQLK